jgi:hypothetical protein
MSQSWQHRANCANAQCAWVYVSNRKRDTASDAAAHRAQTGHAVNVVQEPRPKARPTYA